MLSNARNPRYFDVALHNAQAVNVALHNVALQYVAAQHDAALQHRIVLQCSYRSAPCHAAAQHCCSATARGGGALPRSPS